MQLILKKEHKYAKPVTIGYDRVDGLENIKGPAFSDWMLPMKVSDFKADPDGRISAFYKQQGIDDGATLIAIEHIPSFRFGDVMIDGMKPMTSKAKLMFSDAMFSMAVSKRFHGCHFLEIFTGKKKYGDFKSAVEFFSR